VKRNPVSEQVLLDAMVVSRAFENTCAVVFCNATGPSEEGFAGYSQVAVPFQGCIGKLDSNEEAMKIIDVDTDIVEEAESVYKIRGDMANPSWPYKHS
jgi:predicted amidohydrolase